MNYGALYRKRWDVLRKACDRLLQDPPPAYGAFCGENAFWLPDYARGKKFHTILTFQAENQVIYLELTPQSRKPWYGKELLYASEAQLISEYRKTDCELTDVTDSVRAGSTPEFILSRIG